MEQYKQLIRTILEKGVFKNDRTGVGTKSIFGYQMRFDLQDGFPLVTTKETYFKGIVHELLWFLKGDTNIKYLVDNNVHIWDDWAYQRFVEFIDSTYQSGFVKELLQENLIFEEKDNINKSYSKLTQKEFITRIKNSEQFALTFGDLGPIYGKQWTNWTTITLGERLLDVEVSRFNQIQTVIETLKTNPNDRGIIVSAWNVPELANMALRPCHLLFQFYTEQLTIQQRSKLAKLERLTHSEPEWCDEYFDILNVPKYKLHLQLYQRSADVMLGVPFNIASYALLLSMVAQCVEMIPGEFIHTLGDAHIYSNHIEGAEILIKRECFPLPKLTLDLGIKNIDDFKFESFDLQDYQSHPKIKLPVAV